MIPFLKCLRLCRRQPMAPPSPRPHFDLALWLRMVRQAEREQKDRPRPPFSE